MLRWLRRTSVAPFAALSILAPALSFVLATESEQPAHASSVVALTLDELVGTSDVVAVVTPKSKVARWEAGRIVTYTTVVVDSSVGGGPAAGETLLVRTLGGVVGDIG